MCCIGAGLQPVLAEAGDVYRIREELLPIFGGA
jgi:hypothetical protein